MKSLDVLKEQLEKNKGGGADFEKRKFLTLKDGQKFRIMFLQEIAEDGANYTEERGSALITGVHTSPLNFKIRAGCTAEDEETGFQCFACEQWSENPKENKAWRAKQKFFINVAVKTEDGWEVNLLEQGFGDSHIGNAIVESAVLFGSIMNRDFQLKRTGANFNDTKYDLTNIDKVNEPKEFKDLTLYNFDGLARKIPYAEQQAFYYGVQEDPAKKWA